MSTKQVEIVYFAGCPNVELAIARASEAIRTTGVEARVSFVEVKDADEAIAQRFLGSPSVRVDGIDVEPSARERDDFGMQCRVYSADHRLEGAPPVKWIAAALKGIEVEVGSARKRSAHGCCGSDSASMGAPAAPESVAAALVELLRAVFPPDTAPIFVALARQLAQGAPVSHSELVRAAGRTQREVDEALARIPSLEYVDGTIVGAALTLTETVHVFEIEGKRLYTWCALDALTLPAILSQACRVESRCPGTGELVKVQLSPDRVDDVVPTGASVSVGPPQSCGDLRRSFCDRVRFFASPAAAQKWSNEHGGGMAILSVDEAFRLGRSVAQQLGWAADATQPLVCTLTGRDQSARLLEFRDAFAYLERSERLDEGFRWYFRAEPGLEARLRDLARREQECCRFFEFEIMQKGSSIVWETRAPKHASAVLEEFMRLPETLKAAPNVESVRRALGVAGLTFTSEPPESA